MRLITINGDKKESNETQRQRNNNKNRNISDYAHVY